MELHHCEECRMYLLEIEEVVSVYKREQYQLEFGEHSPGYYNLVYDETDDAEVIKSVCPLCGEELYKSKNLTEKEEEALHIYLWIRPELDWSKGIPDDDPSLVEIFL